MRFYMFGMDEARPEACAEALAARGFSSIVCPPRQRCVDAAVRAGLKAYVCVGAFPAGECTQRCVDADGAQRLWFGSGCPNDDGASAVRVRRWQTAAALKRLSGVLIDGVRFASPASDAAGEALFTCFCPKCRARMTEMGVDAEEVRREVVAWRRGERALPPQTWLTFREDTVRRAMEAFVRTVKTVDSHLTAGAFVFPASLGALVGQAGDALKPLDVVAPMLYRRYDKPEGPATLNHEYAALQRLLGRARVKQFCGVDVPKNVLSDGFVPEALRAETTFPTLPSQTLAPILQIDDPCMKRSVQAVCAGGAQSVGFFMYDEAALRRLPPLDTLVADSV